MTYSPLSQNHRFTEGGDGVNGFGFLLPKNLSIYFNPTLVPSTSSSQNHHPIMSMSSNKPVKILCLHGLGQTGEQMLKSLEPLIKSLPSDWEFVAPDAPNAMPGLRDFA